MELLELPGVPDPPPGSSGTLGPADRKAEELCSRVLTTSSGQVATAPTVPATLQHSKKMAIEISTKEQRPRRIKLKKKRLF